MRANPAFAFDASVSLKRLSDVMLQDIEGSPILAIKDVKHAAAAREASSKADAYAFCPLFLPHPTEIFILGVTRDATLLSGTSKSTK